MTFTEIDINSQAPFTEWRYRFNPFGEREQKRMYNSTLGDMGNEMYAWVYYQLGIDNRQYAVYYGAQSNEFQMNVTAPRYYVIKPDANRQTAFFYPAEYNVYGNESAPKLTYRYVNGQWQKQFKIYDYLGSLRYTISQTGQVLNYKSYEPYGNTILDTFSHPRQGYIGKEKDVESGLGDFGVRKYNGVVFNSPDPLWEKYLGWSPYQYCQNNPVWAKDGNGMKLTFSGSQSAIDKAYSVISNGTGGFYNALTNKDGNTILEPTGKQGKMTPEQSAFYDYMMVATDLTMPNISIYLSESSEKSFGGDYYYQEIDIDDIIYFGYPKGANASSYFIHEIVEQTEKQYGNKLGGYKDSHRCAIYAENKVIGGTRLGDHNYSLTNFNPITGTGIIVFEYLFYLENYRQYTSIELNKNNIKGLTIWTRPLW